MTHVPGQSARTILLRRPAVLSVTEGVFVPPGSGERDDERILDEVDRRWQRCCEENPAYFDGRMYHVLGVHRNGYGGAVIHVIDCAYRFHAVQDETFDLGVRPLGTKGITIRDDRVLVGRRARHVNAYRGSWEFAPGGVVDIGAEPAGVILSELREETGLAARRAPIPIAVLYDDVLRCWEVVFRLEPDAGHPVAEPMEYETLQWRTPDDLPADLTPMARQMSRLLASTLR